MAVIKIIKMDRENLKVTIEGQGEKSLVDAIAENIDNPCGLVTLFFNFIDGFPKENGDLAYFSEYNPAVAAGKALDSEFKPSGKAKACFYFDKNGCCLNNGSPFLFNNFVEGIRTGKDIATEGMLSNSGFKSAKVCDKKEGNILLNLVELFLKNANSEALSDENKKSWFASILKELISNLDEIKKDNKKIENVNVAAATLFASVCLCATNVSEQLISDFCEKQKVINSKFEESLLSDKPKIADYKNCRFIGPSGKRDTLDFREQLISGLGSVVSNAGIAKDLFEKANLAASKYPVDMGKYKLPEGSTVGDFFCLGDMADYKSDTEHKKYKKAGESMLFSPGEPMLAPKLDVPVRIDTAKFNEIIEFIKANAFKIGELLHLNRYLASDPKPSSEPGLEDEKVLKSIFDLAKRIFDDKCLFKDEDEIKKINDAALLSFKADTNERITEIGKKIQTGKTSNEFTKEEKEMLENLICYYNLAKTNGFAMFKAKFSKSFQRVKNKDLENLVKKNLHGKKVIGDSDTGKRNREMLLKGNGGLSPKLMSTSSFNDIRLGSSVYTFFKEALPDDKFSKLDIATQASLLSGLNDLSCSGELQEEDANAIKNDVDMKKSNVLTGCIVSLSSKLEDGTISKDDMETLTEAQKVAGVKNLTNEQKEGLISKLKKGLEDGKYNCPAETVPVEKSQKKLDIIDKIIENEIFPPDDETKKKLKNLKYDYIKNKTQSKITDIVKEGNEELGSAGFDTKENPIKIDGLNISIAGDGTTQTMIDGLNDQITNLKNGLEEANKELNNKKAEIETLNTEITNLKNNSGGSGDYAPNPNEIEELKEQIENLKKDNKKLEECKNEAETNLKNFISNDASEEDKEIIKKLREDVITLNDKITKLDDAKRKAESDLEKLQESVKNNADSAAKKLINAQKEKINQLVKEIEELKKNKEKVDAEYNAIVNNGGSIKKIKIDVTSDEMKVIKEAAESEDPRKVEAVLKGVRGGAELLAGAGGLTLLLVFSPVGGLTLPILCGASGILAVLGVVDLSRIPFISNRIDKDKNKNQVIKKVKAGGVLKEILSEHDKKEKKKPKLGKDGKNKGKKDKDKIN